MTLILKLIIDITVFASVFAIGFFLVDFIIPGVLSAHLSVSTLFLAVLVFAFTTSLLSTHLAIVFPETKKMHTIFVICIGVVTFGITLLAMRGFPLPLQLIVSILILLGALTALRSI